VRTGWARPPAAERARAVLGRATRHPFAVAAIALSATLLLAYAGKAVCLDGETGFWSQNRYCYSDVRVLWGVRGFDVDALPYAGPPADYREDYTLEYPPGLSFGAWAIALLTDSLRGFFNLHALSFAVVAFATLWWLGEALRRTPDAAQWRLLGFSLSPTLVLFGMQNWDLWAVAAAAWGLAAAARGHPFLAAIAWGIGAGIKGWPALLLVVLIAGPWAPRSREGDGDVSRDPADRWLRRDGIDLRPIAVAAAVWAAIQLPAIAISPGGWFDSVEAQLDRRPNPESTPAAIAHFADEVVRSGFWDGTFTDVYGTCALAAFILGLVYIARHLQLRTLDPADAALAIVALGLLTAEFFSPQYVLWLLPVAVVSRVAWTPVLAAEAANAGVWLLYAVWLAHGDDPLFTGFLQAGQGLVLVRTLALGWVFAAALAPRPPSQALPPAYGERRIRISG
jgi:hypothetical protein